MDVLIHHLNSDADPSPVLASLRALLAPFYTVQAVSAAVLASQPWGKSCALLVLLPSDGAEGQVNIAPNVLQAMQSFVDDGGHILALGFDASSSQSRAPSNTLHFWDSTSSTSLSLLRSSSRGTTGHIVVNGVSAVADAQKTGAPLPAIGQAVAYWASNDSTKEPESVAGTDIRIGGGGLSLWNVGFSGLPAGAIQNVLKIALTSIGLLKGEEGRGQVDLPPVPQCPLPQLLLAPPSRPDVLEAVLQAIGVSPDTDSEHVTLKDSADTFRFHFASATRGVELVEQARQVTESSSDGPRDVVILPSGTLPSPEITPRFNVGRFFTELDRSTHAPSRDGGWRMGEALLYGEAVTSTQTLLERNPKLLSSLPPPIVSVASFQLAGRGRGSNTWLSPEGCLQFSTHLRITLSTLPAPRLVFVQYLFGLAVVNACKDARALGGDLGARVGLKWPNDIYIDRGGGSQPKKAGGILVNTSFTGGKVDVIIGCGLNVSTPPPMASLSALAGKPLEVETVLALILSKFESLWATFVGSGGSWMPFEDAYLDAWMHSDQLVSIAAVAPALPQQVRILGITPDHGLLRTVPVSGGGTYIDLQPDGNSFDLMEGLIKAKK